MREISLKHRCLACSCGPFYSAFETHLGAVATNPNLGKGGTDGQARQYRNFRPTKEGQPRRVPEAALPPYHFWDLPPAPVTFLGEIAPSWDVEG